MNTTRKDAFSLIEVVIALGIFSFAMVGIFALIPVSMNSIRSVSNEIRANEIAETIFGIWEIAPSEMLGGPSLITIPGINSSEPGGVVSFSINESNPEMFFDEGGYLVDDSSRASIKLDYQVSGEEEEEEGGAAVPTRRVILNFSWPPTADTDSPLRREISFSRYFISE